MIAYLRAERGGPVVAAAIMGDDNRCFAHAVNLCEVYYDFHRSEGEIEARLAIADLKGAGIVESAEMGADFWRTAAVLKSVHRRVSLADCFAIALAQTLRGTILTADHHEFDALSDGGVCAVQFIR